MGTSFEEVKKNLWKAKILEELIEVLNRNIELSKEAKENSLFVHFAKVEMFFEHSNSIEGSQMIHVKTARKDDNPVRIDNINSFASLGLLLDKLFRLRCVSLMSQILDSENYNDGLLKVIDSTNNNFRQELDSLFIRYNGKIKVLEEKIGLTP